MSNSPWTGASTTARPAISQAERATSVSRSASVAACPSRRLNVPIRRSPSTRACAARAVPRARPAKPPASNATMANTTNPMRSRGLPIVNSYRGGMKKKSHSRKLAAAAASAARMPATVAAAITAVR